jgi:hypothetical protein
LAYLGNRPAESYASFERQVFTIVNSQTAYTLSHSVTNENDIRLVVNNVVQEPGSGKAYTASGTTLTLSAALVNGTDEMYCVFLGRALQTVNPPNASVGSAQVADSLISGKTALGATPADTDELLISDAGTLKRVDFSNLKQANTPAFLGLRSTTQTLAASSTVTITYDSEDIDSDSALNISTGVFTVPSGKAGTYFFIGTITSAADMGSGEILSLNLNGSDSNDEFGLRIDTLNSRVVGTISGMKYMDVGDTMHFEIDNGTNSSTSNIVYARFGGFRLIGV